MEAATELETREGVVASDTASALGVGHTDAGKCARGSPTECGRPCPIRVPILNPFRSVPLLCCHGRDTM
jgi:hypothetical protein